jgi:glycosyltransferase involved in cell wall biosynthesis
MISVLILTRNEEKDLPACLASVSWCDDIHVFDSFSTDQTVEIARESGATVTQRKFDNWAAHQNWGLANLPFKHAWVLYIDADERVTEPLVQNAVQAIQQAGDRVAFRIRRRDFLGNHCLEHVQASPYYLRLFRPEKMHYERLVNPVSVPDGPVADLAGYLDHYPFSKGMSHWLDRHNSYSTLEAQQLVENRRGRAAFSFWSALTHPDFNERRFHQKELFYRLPMRPILKFLLLYVFKRGFLDGHAGFVYATLQSIYEYMIVLKTAEMKIAEIKTGPVFPDVADSRTSRLA